MGIIDPLIDAVIDDDPRDYGYRATVWTAPLLQRYVQEVHAIPTSRKSVSRSLARLGIRWNQLRHRLAGRPDSWRQAKGGSKTAAPVTSARGHQPVSAPGTMSISPTCPTSLAPPVRRDYDHCARRPRLISDKP